MKAVGYLMGTCLFLAVVNAAATALMLLTIAAIVIGAIFKPRETLGLLGFFAIANLFAVYPLGCLIVTGLLAAVALTGNVLRKGKAARAKRPGVITRAAFRRSKALGLKAPLTPPSN